MMSRSLLLSRLSRVPVRSVSFQAATKGRILRYGWLSASILAAPVLVLGTYAAVRFTRIEDDEASLYRHHFVDADGAADVPQRSVQELFEWRGHETQSLGRLLVSSSVRCVVLGCLFAPLALASPLLLFDSTRAHWWRLMRAALARAGPCFLKFGQWAAARPDLFAESLCAELALLHDQCPAHSAAATRRAIEQAFGKPVDELFSEFDDTPLASGAVAQVHRARMRDGLEVAVKVLHPDIASRIESDMRLLHALASLVHCLPRMEFLALPQSVEQFATTMVAQIDLRFEARNMRRFARNFANDRRVRFARPLAPSLCHADVLIQSFEHGRALKDFLPSSGRYQQSTVAQRRVVAHAGASAYLRMMLLHNFVHADLHPGNILVEPSLVDKDDARVVLLDCGMVSELSDRDNENFIALFTALCDGDAAYGAQLMLERAKFVEERMRVTTGDASADVDERRRGFVRDMSATLGVLKDAQLSEIRVGEVMHNVFNISRKYGVQVDATFTTLVVGTAVIEGVARQLDPHISLIDVAGPILLRRHALMARERVSRWLRDDSWLQG
jgi:aarF domain-containing kinase